MMNTTSPAHNDFQKASYENEQHYKDIFNYSSDCIFLIDAESDCRFKYTMFNPAEEKSVGLTNKQVKGKYVDDLFDAELAGKLNKRYMSCYKQGTIVSYEEDLLLPSGAASFYTSLIPLKNSSGKTNSILGISRDITELKLKSIALRERIKMETAIADCSQLFVSEEIDVNHVLRILGEATSASRVYVFRLKENNSKMDRLYSWMGVDIKPQEEKSKDIETAIIPWWIEKLQQGENIELSTIESLPPQAFREKAILQKQNIKSVFTTPIYSVRGFLTGFMSIGDAKGCREWSDEDARILRVVAEMIGVYWDRKKDQEDLKYRLTYDHLTQLPNRNFLEEHLLHKSKSLEENGKSFIFFIGIDNFKIFNDTLGRKAGDQILIEVAKLLKESIDKNSLLVRLDGDEFGVLLEGISQSEAATIADKFRKTVYESQIRVLAQQHSMNLSVSIGVSKMDYSNEYQNSMLLAKRALYLAKEEGKNKVMIAEGDLEPLKDFSEINLVIGKIKEALKNNHFILLYQPIFNLVSGDVMHYEALIRLQDEDGQMILPEAFIPVAETFGIMPQIDLWVVQSVLSLMQKKPELKIFINLSGSTLGDSEALSNIESLIFESGVSSSRVGFEITETTVIKDLRKAEQWISRFKEMGCLFALDDFGTGFSSFSYLTALPVDYVKLDHSFIFDIERNPVHRAIVEAVFNVATALGKFIIAECVENEEVYAIIKEIGLHGGQGFLLGKPTCII
ncbi:MAG: EAL domain-containing protein [Clostridia bacterium]|nr:EAL domain-containing protein [Clostridia bacterium]